MYFRKSSERINETRFHYSLYCFKNLRVEIDNQGNLHQIVNLNKSITVPFVTQGFYWYQGTSITNIKSL